MKLNTFETQYDKNNRPFRLSGTRKNSQMPQKWIDKVLKNHWIYSFIFLDSEGGMFEIEIDYKDIFVNVKKMLK